MKRSATFSETEPNAERNQHNSSHCSTVHLHAAEMWVYREFALIYDCKGRPSVCLSITLRYGQTYRHNSSRCICSLTDELRIQSHRDLDRRHADIWLTYWTTLHPRVATVQRGPLKHTINLLTQSYRT